MNIYLTNISKKDFKQSVEWISKRVESRKGYSPSRRNFKNNIDECIDTIPVQSNMVL